MKQTLQFTHSQQLTMTPQLQQSIKLLQLSTFELHHEIQQALDENPLLELADESEPGETELESTTTDLDGDWTPSCQPNQSSSPSFEDREQDYYQGSTSLTLQEHLLWQLQLSRFSQQDEVIARIIIDSINDRGYLTVPVADLVAIIERQIDTPIDYDEVAVTLKRIQQFDPIGVAASTVRECLLMQLQHLPEDTPFLALAITAVDHHLELLGSRDYRNLARKLRITVDELAPVVALIQSLNPNPGDGFGDARDHYVIPDVMVRKKNGLWKVELNSQSMPKLKVSESYASLNPQVMQTDDMQYIRQHTQEAKWFIRSLESRNDTLLKVATCIVDKQQGFFEHGEEAMVPMVLADVARVVDMHESTISRVTTQKYMHTPRGMFELKYFFSSQLATAQGEDTSSIAIKAMLKKLVATENPKKPLSDNRLAELLAEQGIQVARRTIAKYREALNIPSSSQRKRLI